MSYNVNIDGVRVLENTDYGGAMYLSERTFNILSKKHIGEGTIYREYRDDGKLYVSIVPFNQLFTVERILSIIEIIPVQVEEENRRFQARCYIPR